jgi:dipeptidyl-peptidase-3
MFTTQEKKTHTISQETKACVKDFSEAFKDLTPKEKMYAYHFARASWEGSLMVLHQVSYESPIIFCLGQFFFANREMNKLREAATKAGVSKEMFDDFVAYFAGFYGNMGNYHSFGHKKIVPVLNEEDFLKVYQSAPHFNEFEGVFEKKFEEVWGWVSKEIFSIKSPYNSINLPFKGGVTGYFSRSLSQEELDMMNRFLASRKQSPLNTRSFKKEENGKIIYEITVGSTEKEVTEHEFEGKTIRVVRGEFSEYLSGTVTGLTEARKYARSEIQEGMLDDYVAHFKSGDMELHVESQKKWIQDKGPTIETNIGYIETYLDPQNIRAYFEGFVSIVNKTRSQKYSTLVGKYEEIIKAAPWPRNYCKDKFLKPDFTSLDVITFATTGCPLGINIPNYDLVRNDYGFKNVYLANNAADYSNVNFKFLTPEDSKLLNDFGSWGYTLHVALHELIGHGSGKLFFEDENGKLNYDPETTLELLSEAKVKSHYKHGETWNEKFGKISCSYEECRADVCGIFLGFEPKAYEIFGFSEDNIVNAMAATVMNHLRKAVLGLKLYNVEMKKWGQAHTQGAFVFLNFMLKHQDPKNKVVDILLSAEQDDFLFKINRENLPTEGRRVTGELLKHLQQYKSTADAEAGEIFYNKYSQVNDFFLKIREIVLENQKARRLDIYHELRVEEGNVVEKKTDVSLEGIVGTFHRHWERDTQDLIRMVLREWAWRGNSQTLRV